MANHGRRYDAERRGERQEKSAHSSGGGKSRAKRAALQRLRERLRKGIN